ncbi:MAG: hypothetical protein Q8880_06400 [Bacteroidota bacterium]|nr:hypothetical protein [Bacteroidota bacterium]
MKKIISYLLLIISIVLITSCKNSNKPEVVAEKFVNLVFDKKYAEAKKLGTQNTAKMIDMLENISKLNPKSTDTDNDSRPENFQVLMKNDSIAVVSYFQKGAENKLDMIKKDGNWLVDMKKEPGYDDEDPNTNPNDIDTSLVNHKPDSLLPND